MADSALLQILTALLRHQVKNLLGDDALGVIGQELTAIGGEKLDKQIRKLLVEKSTAEALEKAVVSVRDCFRGRVSDDEVEQWMVMLPLENLPSVISALEELPTSPDERKLERALGEAISLNWQKLSSEQVNNAVSSYLFCLRSALLPIEEQTLAIIGRSVLRTEDKVEQLIALFNKYVVEPKSKLLHDDNVSTQQQSWDISEGKYRERVKELHSKIRILNRESVQIDSFYVELSITSGLSSKQHHSAKDLEKDFRDARRLSRKEREAHLRDLIVEKDKIFLSGKPGSGKTVSLKYLAVLAATNRIEKLPVFISLTDLVNSSQELMQYIVEQFELCEFPNLDMFIETSLKRGNLLFLFDGFDEVLEETGQRAQVQKDIIKFVEKYPDNKFVISCRTAASNYQFANFAYFEINDFDEGQADSYIRNWFANNQDTANQFVEQLQQPQYWNVKEITQNPLLLNLLCVVFEETKRIPSKKSDLYREAMDCLLQKWDESKGIKRDQIYRVLSLKNKKRLLAFLAFKFSNRGTIFFDQDKAATTIVDFLNKLKPQNNKDEIDGNIVLNAIEAQHGLIIKRAEYIFSFSHLSFQEYFASRHVVETNTKSVLKEFFSHINDGSWEEIFLLTSSMQEDADSFFNKFIKEVTSLVSKDKKLKNILKWCDEKREDSYEDIHPALGRMIAAKTLLNIDNIVDQLKPEVSGRDQFVAIQLAKFLHLDTKLDVNLSVLSEIANCIALNKPLTKSLRDELIRILKAAENRIDFYQDGSSIKQDFDYEQARGKIRNYILSLEQETKQQFKVDLDSIWSDDLVRQFSSVVGDDLLNLKASFIYKERILANNKMPKQNAGDSEWNSFRQGVKKDVLGEKSLLYDLNMTVNQRSRLIDYLSANILLAKCLHISDTVDISKFENALITV